MKTEDLRKQYCNESKEKYIEFASLEELQHYVEWLESKLTSIKNEREKLAEVQSVLVNRMKSSKIKPSTNRTAKEILQEVYLEHSSPQQFDHNKLEWKRIALIAMKEYASQLKPDAKEFGKITEKNLKDAIRRIKQDKSKDERLREIIENSLYRF